MSYAWVEKEMAFFFVDDSKIKASILDISFCGDYHELHVSLDDYDKKELLVKTCCIKWILKSSSSAVLKSKRSCVSGNGM